jgi:hypothetical protein
MKPGPRKVKGGIDDGTDWKELTIVPEVDPEAMANVLNLSFNEAFILQVKRYIDELVEGFGPTSLTRGNMAVTKEEK